MFQWPKRGDSTEMIAFFDRMKVQGEVAALQWVSNRNR